MLASKAGQVRWGATVGPWLHATAVRLARKALRRTSPAPAAPAEVPAPAADPVAALAWAECCRALDEELAALPEVLRGPLVLCYLQGRTRDEAAHCARLLAGDAEAPAGARAEPPSRPAHAPRGRSPRRRDRPARVRTGCQRRDGRGDDPRGGRLRRARYCFARRRGAPRSGTRRVPPQGDGARRGRVGAGRLWGRVRELRPPRGRKAGRAERPAGRASERRGEGRRRAGRPASRRRDRQAGHPPAAPRRARRSRRLLAGRHQARVVEQRLPRRRADDLGHEDRPGAAPLRVARRALSLLVWLADGRGIALSAVTTNRPRSSGSSPTRRPTSRR